MVWIYSASAKTLLTVALVGFFFGSDVNAIADDVRITMRPDIINTEYLPLTETEAIEWNWEIFNYCDEKAEWRGTRYFKEPDYSVALLFDSDGLIAGIQMGILANRSQHDTFPSVTMRRYFVYDYLFMYSTVYFQNPLHICTPNRGTRNYNQTGIVEKLYYQDGPTYAYYRQFVPRDFLRYGFGNYEGWELNTCVQYIVPQCKLVEVVETLNISHALLEKYHRGREIRLSQKPAREVSVTSGYHYLHNVDESFDCSNYLPFFLMVDGHDISGFGWMFYTVEYHPRFEVLPTSKIREYIFYSPECIELQRITTLHVYLKRDINAIRC